MCFTVKIGNNIHFEGSLLNCLKNAYGLNNFVIINSGMFNSTFSYSFNEHYDYEFLSYCNCILTSKELDKFKRMMRK